MKRKVDRLKKIGKNVARMIKIKSEKTKITKIRNEEGILPPTSKK